MGSVTKRRSIDRIETPTAERLVDELPRALRAVERRCARTDIPLDEWLWVLSTHSETVCLRCRLGRESLFLTWRDDESSLYELRQRAGEGMLPLQSTGVVRTVAALETADAIHLVDRSETPVAWSVDRR